MPFAPQGLGAAGGGNLLGGAGGIGGSLSSLLGSANGQSDGSGILGFIKSLGDAGIRGGFGNKNFQVGFGGQNQEREQLMKMLMLMLGTPRQAQGQGSVNVGGVAPGAQPQLSQVPSGNPLLGGPPISLSSMFSGNGGTFGLR